MVTQYYVYFLCIAYQQMPRKRNKTAFHKYLDEKVNINDRIGDFARDNAVAYRVAIEYPKSCGLQHKCLLKEMSREKWLQYLEDINACDGAVESFKMAWDDFERTR